MSDESIVTQIVLTPGIRTLCSVSLPRPQAYYRRCTGNSRVNVIGKQNYAARRLLLRMDDSSCHTTAGGPHTPGWKPVVWSQEPPVGRLRSLYGHGAPLQSLLGTEQKKELHISIAPVLVGSPWVGAGLIIRSGHIAAGRAIRWCRDPSVGRPQHRHGRLEACKIACRTACARSVYHRNT